MMLFARKGLFGDRELPEFLKAKFKRKDEV